MVIDVQGDGTGTGSATVIYDFQKVRHAFLIEEIRWVVTAS